MTFKERALAAINNKPTDVPPVFYFYSKPGFYEYGEKFNDLLERHPGDLEKFERQPVPVFGPECFDKEGNYYVTDVDEWGTHWEYKIYGAWGHAYKLPLDDLDKAKEYQFPPHPAFVTDPIAFTEEKAKIEKIQQNYPYRISGVSLLEKLNSIRSFEDVLCDLVTDDPRMIDFMDRLTDYYEEYLTAVIKLKPDMISFGDDYGTQESLLFSHDIFKTHFKPRWARLIKPIKEAGIHVHFHSCGKIDPLFEDMKEMGVDSIWPQIPAYDSMEELDSKCRAVDLGMCIHTDRGTTMTAGTPEQVRELVKKEMEVFKPTEGGRWFHIEIDSGFPWENTKALIETIYNYR